MVKVVKIRNAKRVIDDKSKVTLKLYKNRVLCVILGESKGANLIWINSTHDSFSYNNNTYFLQDEGIFITPDNVRCCVYLEGVSTPISPKYIQKELIKRKIKVEGKEKEVTVAVIKGLKYDSKIIDVLLNRGLARIFTNIKEDKIFYIVFFMTLALTVIGIVNIGVTIYYA